MSCFRVVARKLSTSRGSVGIVGAGPSGLMLAALLNRQGVQTVLIEKSAELPSHPQAHYVNGRTMEILRHDLGIESKVTALSPPVEQWRDFVFSTAVFGGRELARVDNLSHRADERVPLSLRSACSPTHLSQPKLVRLLLEAAKEPRRGLAPDIRFNCGLVGFTEKGDGVEVDLATGEKLKVSYLVAADGANSLVREKLGIRMVGPENMATLMNIHFRLSSPSSLDSSQGARGNHNHADSAMLYFVYNPETVAVFVNHGGGDDQGHQWVCQVPFIAPFQTVASFTPDYCARVVAAGMGVLPEEVEVLSAKPWTMHAQVAETYQSPSSSKEHSRVFLVGDAAHRFPPAGGFGMNTGIQDAHNLAFKLAAALVGKSGGGGVGAHRRDGEEHGVEGGDNLSSYEMERRPVAVNNTVLSKRNYERVLGLSAVLGVDGKQLVQASKLLEQRFGLDKWWPVNNAIAGAASGAALALARAPLRCLSQEGHFLGDARVAALRQVLGEGSGGLPLVFPKHELAFRYLAEPCKESKEEEDRRRRRHQAGYPLCGVGVGVRAPHCRLVLRHPAFTTPTPSPSSFSSSASSSSSSSPVFTLTDLPAQLHEHGVASKTKLRPHVLVIDEARFRAGSWPPRDGSGALALQEAERVDVIVTISPPRVLDSTVDECVETEEPTAGTGAHPFPAPPWKVLKGEEAAAQHERDDGAILIEAADTFGDWSGNLKGAAFVIRPDGHISWFDQPATTK